MANFIVVDIFALFREHARPAQAATMAAYMKHKFEFLGLKRPERNELQRAFIQQKRAESYVDEAFILKCWNQPEREFQYLAMDYFKTKLRHVGKMQLTLIHELITHKSWWDTVDFIAATLVGSVVRSFPELKAQNIACWCVDEDLWVRRAAILFQLKFGKVTDTDFLTAAIEYNLGSKEFFINKAIGWALRQHSKHDPGWVKSFVKNHKMSALSIREASKYL